MYSLVLSKSQVARIVIPHDTLYTWYVLLGHLWKNIEIPTEEHATCICTCLELPRTAVTIELWTLAGYIWPAILLEVQTNN
jgi:hypothetical protein